MANGLTHHLHLVSDATGETISSVARACLAQFEDADPVEHNWTLIRTGRQMEKVLEGIVSQIAVGRLGRGEEIADMVSYLVGERAGFVTGATLTLNGGQFMAG